MAKQYWRIGIRYIDFSIFQKGYPYVWGEGVTESNYLDYLTNIKVGDIIVAGGVEKISLIGEVKSSPVYLFPGEENRDWSYEDDYGIAVAKNKKMLEAFEPLENDFSDIVCIETAWYNIDCSNLRMPRQPMGGIRQFNDPGKQFIADVIKEYKKNPQKQRVNLFIDNPLLNFTAIDFETATGYRNSVCQIGLVKVVNGIITDEYCGLIQPPNNYIREDFSAIHGIYPEQTIYAPTFENSYPNWKHFLNEQILVAHNMKFDISCLKACLKDFCGLEIEFKTYCTMKIWKGEFENAQLSTCCENNDISLEYHHNALNDAKACAELFIMAVKNGRDLKEDY
jgi:DNA polymerase-3 subunit epsilon